MKKLRSCLALLLAVIMLVPSFALPAASLEPDFTMSVEVDNTDYSVGDIVTATVYVSPNGKTVNSYQFTIDCSSYLQIQSCTSKIGDPNNDPKSQKDGTYAFVVTGKGAAIEGDKLAIAEIKFKVLSTFTGTVSANIGLKNCYVGEQGTATDPYTVFDGARYVNLHKYVITLDGGSGGSINGKAQVALYAKHNVPGLYSDADCTVPVTGVTVTAEDGYVLSSPQWFDGKNCYEDFAAVASASFADSKTIYLQTVKKPILTVSDEGVTGGALNKTGTLVVLPNADVSDQTLRDAGFIPTAKNGYTFAGWNVGSQPLGTTGTVKVSADATVKPVFTANKYGFEGPAASDDYTAVITGGVDADGQVTHDTDVTMTISPSANHAVQVGYTVNETPHVITPTNGVYTIPGENILGDVVVTVTAVEYRTVTFKAGDGVDMTETKLYTLPASGGLFTDATCTKPTDAPVPGLQDGYRAPDENKNEAWWTDAAGKTYTSAALKTGPINDDLVVTANAIKQIKVSFVAGANGSLDGTLEQTVDAGSSFASIPKPETIAATGYNFEKWAPVVENVGNEDTTFTATFVRGQYTVSLPSAETYDITVTAADGIIDNGDGNYTVTYGTSVNFTVSGKNGATITEVSYKVEGKDAVVLGTAAGSYTIPGSEITAAVGISVDVDKKIKITFNAGEHGSYNGAACVDRYFENGYTLTEEDIPVPTPYAGYEFSGWIDEDPEGQEVSGSKEYTAWYAPGKYEVKIDGETKDYATYLEDYKLPAYSDSKVITGIKVTVAGKDVEVAKDTAGNFVIDGSKITGTVNVVTTSTPVTITFIYQEQYGAIADGKKMAVLQTAKLDGSCYALSDGVAFFWSDKYQAYVRFVSAAGMTEAQLASQLQVVEGDATEISYIGDISGNDIVNVVDAGIINDTLTGNISPDQVSDIMRFKMDVSNDKPSDDVTVINGQYIQVTTGDIQTIINTSVGY